MGRFAPAEHIEDALAAIGKYDPDTMPQFIADLGELPDMTANFARIFDVLARKAATELPAAPTVVALLEEMARIGRAVSVAAEEVAPGARRAHEADLARHETPRPGEEKWNV